MPSNAYLVRLFAISVMHMVAIVAFVAFVKNARHNEWRLSLETLFLVMTGVAIYAAVFVLLWHALPASQ